MDNNADYLLPRKEAEIAIVHPQSYLVDLFGGVELADLPDSGEGEAGAAFVLEDAVGATRAVRADCVDFRDRRDVDGRCRQGHF